jgi:hypothetical protein
MAVRGSKVFLHQTLIYYRSEFARVRYTRLSDLFQEPAMYCEVPLTPFRSVRLVENLLQTAPRCLLASQRFADLQLSS